MKQIKVKYVCGHKVSVWIVPEQYLITLVGMDQALQTTALKVSQDRCPRCE